MPLLIENAKGPYVCRNKGKYTAPFASAQGGQTVYMRNPVMRQSFRGEIDHLHMNHIYTHECIQQTNYIISSKFCQ